MTMSYALIFKGWCAQLVDLGLSYVENEKRHTVMVSLSIESRLSCDEHNVAFQACKTSHLSPSLTTTTLLTPQTDISPHNNARQGKRADGVLPRMMPTTSAYHSRFPIPSPTHPRYWRSTGFLAARPSSSSPPGPPEPPRLHF